MNHYRQIISKAEASQHIFIDKSERASADKVYGDKACLGENLSCAKWCCDVQGLEARGQPEDRW